MILCEHLFSGRISDFAAHANVNAHTLTRVLQGAFAPRPKLLTQIVKAGLVNAEWLLCGTGPPLPEEADATKSPLLLASQINTRLPVFDTTAVPVSYAGPATLPAVADAATPDNESLKLARAIYAARVRNKPCVLYLGADVISDGASSVAIALLKKGYVTGVALSCAAASADIELALLGGLADSRPTQVLSRLNDAIYMAAAHGVGYGEALARWCFAGAARRENSVIAESYASETPVTIHGGIGDALHHFYPARRSLEFGAALGAALYVDALLFAEQLRECAGNPPGVLISTDPMFHALYLNSLAAVVSVSGLDTAQVKARFIGGPYRHSVPALLAACDAVYDGSAVNAKRKRTL